MCEVTRNNFKELFPEIKKVFESSSFLSIDCEFSSIHSGTENQNSLFDNPSLRYYKSRENIKQAIPFQVGVTAFQFERDENVYIAKPYIFYTIPLNFSSIDRLFICTSSSLSFLCDYKFDFNKFIYQGIPFLNKTEEELLMKSVKDGTLFSNVLASLQNALRDSIQVLSSKVSEWFYVKENVDELELFDTESRNFDYLYVLHKELRSRFSDKDFVVWTYVENNKFKVKKVSREEYSTLSSNSNLDNELIDNYLGFTKVFRLMTSIKKPIVGHNLFLDILLILNSFENEIPKNYNMFKKLCVEKLPIVFDTKFLSFEIRKYLELDQKWESNGLEQLYTYFKNEKGRHLTKKSPRIEMEKDFEVFQLRNFHDAGWDSYCTGYCFIRMAHYFAAMKYEDCTRVLMSSEHLKAVMPYRNHVNVIRATVSHLNLEGVDPVSRRPPCIIIHSKYKTPIDISKITDILSVYGSVEVKPYSDGGRTAIAAVANYSSARRILSKFHNHRDFTVANYNLIRHSPVIRAALWGGVIMSSTALAWLLRCKILI